MRITKDKLLYLVKQNIQEMAMDFDGPERPGGDVERDLQRGDTPLSIVPTPETNRADQNFLELLASERYREVVSKVRQMTNYQGPISGQNIGPLSTMMMNAHYRIMELESAHKVALQDLAVEVVVKEMGLPENYRDYINFVVELNEPSTEGFKMGGQISPPKKDSPQLNDDEFSDEEIANITPENREIEMELFQDIQNVDTTEELEESKLRLIKAIIQGSSKKGHWMYQLLGQRIREITGSDELFNLYGIMMSVNDLNYWQFAAGQLTVAMRNSVAGRVDVVRPTQGQDDEEPLNMGGGDEDEEDNEEDFDDEMNQNREDKIDPTKTNIIVNGVNFPVLIHECMKGIMKMIAIQGQPEKQMYKKVRDKQELMEYEIWDLRLGPAIWRRLYQAFPEEVLEENNRELQNFVMGEIFALPAKKFLVLMKEVMGETPRGKRLIALIYDGVVKMLNDEDYEEAIQRYENELDGFANSTNDDQLIGELNDIFGDKGFTLTKDDLDDEEESDEDFLNQFK